nr:nuclease-related domain-containing protein [Leifsonia psychrotolerans]
MRQRCAGQSVLENLVRHQADAPPRSRIARFFGRSPLGAEASAWYQAAQGEIAMGRILDQLPPEWTVLHALPAGLSALDIDHLIIGPCGIFTVNTKHHSDTEIWVAESTLLVDGQMRNYIPDAETEAQRVSAIIEERMPLPAPVQPVVAFVDSKRVTIRQKPAQVKVVDAWQIRRWLTNLTPVLSPTEQHQVAELLDDPGTWHETGPVQIVPGEAVRHPGVRTPAGLTATFELLATEVDAAAARRRVWKLAAYAALVLTPVMALPYLLSLLG